MQTKLFSAEEANGILWYKFKSSRWGKLQDVLPLEQLGACLPTTKYTCERKGYFDNRGKVALMFLKHELGVSDEKLIDHINHFMATISWRPFHGDHFMATITPVFNCSLACGWPIPN